MIRFSSPAAGDVIMLDEHAQRLLDLMQKPRGKRGVILAQEIPAVLARLRAAIRDERAQAAPPEEPEDGDARPREEAVDLGRRAYPLIDMLERSAKRKVDVTWGL